jgi:hypothetical protein
MKDRLVPPLHEREDDAAPGPFYVVKRQCLICDFPNQMAEGNFSWDDAFQKGGCTGCPNHCRVEKQPETPEELAQVIEAALGSCVEAIRYCGTDPEVLAKFGAEGKAHLCDALQKSR